jgi:superfamily II DNA/RNA helicase
MADGTILETFSGVEVYTRGLQAAAASLNVTQTMDEESGETTQHVRMVEPSPKLDAVEAFLEDEPDGESYVCWFVNRDLMAMAAARFTEKGRTFAEIHGDKTDEERDEAVRAFQAGEVQFILCQAKAASEGTTMTRSRTALYIQQPESFIVTSQSEDRLHRIGAEVHDSIRIVRFVASETTEAEIALKIERKQGISDQMFLEMGLD